MAPPTPAVRATRSSTGGKPKTGTKPQPRRKETPRGKASAKAATKNATQKEMKEFMERQAKINETILEQLQSIGSHHQKDKCGRASNSGTSQQADGSGGRGLGVRGKQPNVEDITIPSPSSGSSESDENGSDYEALARDDMNEANELLKAHFKNTTGRVKSSKRIENDIRNNRPYAFLARDTQRALIKEGAHPEELSYSLHIEGFTAMIRSICANHRVRAMIDHLHNLIHDAQVHPWHKVRRWSNEVIVKTAIHEWQWTDVDKIVQAKNALYMIAHAGHDTDSFQPCFWFNKGTCTFEFTHYEGGQTAAHVCSFCFLLDGNRESHQAKNCGRRRSSANYFKNREENPHTVKKDKFKTKGAGGKDLTERQSKN